MPTNIFGQKMPNQPRAVDRKQFRAPPEEDTPVKRQTETLVSALRSRAPGRKKVWGSLK